MRLALQAALRGSAGEVLRALLPGEAPLVELGALVAVIGAPAQPLHSDTPFQQQRLLTLFLPLPALPCSSQGPTVMLPQTHCDAAHAAQKKLKTRKALQADIITLATEDVRDAESRERNRRAHDMWGERVCTAQVGEAFLMDSRLLHYGGAKSEGPERVVLYATFATPHCCPYGSTYTLRY